ncbi:MAG TPA: hypothetical protein VH062_28140 [Polyangiaceae bacterium]|jgi:hypothetical protein|nr:hypothetical protein [Polyangiaceae bacterium]
MARFPFGRSAIAAIACLLAAAAVSTACGAQPVSLAQGPREYVATDYERVLDRWTRTEQLFVASELDDLLTATATYESWDFRWAYVVRYAEDYRLTVDQRRALFERSLAEADKFHSFYVAVYAQRHQWSDLTAENAAWIIRLIDDKGNETAPSEIEAIRRPGAIERTYFPYTSPWRRAYRVRFPVSRADGRRTIASDARWFGLRFAGAQGNEQLVWLVDPDPNRHPVL